MNTNTEIAQAVPASVIYTQTPSCFCLTVSGNWQLETPWPQQADQALQAIETTQAKTLLLTAKDLGSWDSSLLAFLRESIECAKKRSITLQSQLPESINSLITLAFAVDRKAGSDKKAKSTPFLERLGASVLTIPVGISDFLEFFGSVILSLLRLLSGRSSMRAGDLFTAMYECGVNSLPIIAITNMLFGLILAFVGAVQLTYFGAQIYVAGLVGIGMLRVMGAVMVGVVMSGRVGAAYAALLGTMQVNEEIDALETMGISPIDFLVLPRMLALTFMVPLLTIFADLMGIVGGFFVGVVMLDLTPLEYLTATQDMVSYTHGVVGLVYATVFGMVIAVFGCYHGIRCSRSAQGVGQATTTAVVHSLVGIIVCTAIITVICNIFNV